MLLFYFECFVAPESYVAILDFWSGVGYVGIVVGSVSYLSLGLNLEKPVAVLPSDSSVSFLSTIMGEVGSV